MEEEKLLQRERLKAWREKNKDVVSKLNKKFYNKYTKIYKRVGKWLKEHNRELFDDIVNKIDIDE